MPGKIYQYLADDHARLDALLQRATARPDTIEASAYAEFRAGLLKHIAMEEKTLLPAAQRLRDGKPLPIASKLPAPRGVPGQRVRSTRESRNRIHADLWAMSLFQSAL